MPSADEILGFGVVLPARVYRVSKSKYPSMQVPPLVAQGAGRFDDSRDKPGGGAPDFGVLYCGDSAASSFLETLATLRENLSTIGEVSQATMMDVEEKETSDHLVERARIAVSDRWLSERALTRVAVGTDAPLFDLANPEAVQFLRERMSLMLLYMKISDLDFGTVLGQNRQFTQMLSRWLWSMKNDAGKPLFSGIRYRSRFDPECICLALYEDRYTVDGDIDTQPITSNTPGFAEAASILRLQIA